jgi:serine/threonine protein kinase
VRINPADMPAYSKGLERFLDEARTLAQFRDPRIVHVHGFHEAHNTAYMVMDFEEGVTLRDHVLQNGVLSADEARRILVDILYALQLIHGRNYLHRDIKPANLLRRPNGSVLLLDFGSARITQQAHEQAFTVIITPGYAPMEQYGTNETQGPATDLYAVGACMLFCLSGMLPVDAMKRMIAKNGNDADPLESQLSRLSARQAADKELTAVLRWMLEPQAEQRPQSAAAVLQRLDFTPRTQSATQPMTQIVEPPTMLVDLTQVRSIPSKMVEPIRQQLHAVFGDESTQILVQAIRGAKNAQHLVDNLSHQMADDPRRTEIVGKVAHLLSTATLKPGEISATRPALSPANDPRRSSSTVLPPAAPPTRVVETVKDQETTQLLSSELAKFIGPIAKMVVKKRSNTATNISELVELLSAEIAVAADREAFRKTLIKLQIITH